ncbi:Uma2 family endonuclease [Sphingomonas gilva]|nr:Uma2 family endonuclease [Sphingomonas gilva]
MTVFQNVQKGLIPARLTVADVYALQEAGVISEGENFELIEGEIVPMAAAKFSHHEWMKSRLNEALVLAKPADTALFVEPSVALSEITFVEPDIAIWPRTIESQEVRGPDLLLVIEVAVSSIGYDLRVKARLYAEACVREYWVVDAVRKTIRVHRDPVEGAYCDVREYEAHDTVSAMLPSIAIRLDTLD